MSKKKNPVYVENGDDIVKEHVSEAKRYIANARETLKKAEPIVFDHYSDEKYVREAAGIGYLAVFKALNGYFLGKVGLLKKELPKNYDAYIHLLNKYTQKNKTFILLLNTIYDDLHVEAYYRGNTQAQAVNSALKRALTAVNYIEKNVLKN